MVRPRRRHRQYVGRRAGNQLAVAEPGIGSLARHRLNLRTLAGAQRGIAYQGGCCIGCGSRGHHHAVRGGCATRCVCYHRGIRSGSGYVQRLRTYAVGPRGGRKVACCRQLNRSAEAQGSGSAHLHRGRSDGRCGNRHRRALCNASRVAGHGDRVQPGLGSGQRLRSGTVAPQVGPTRSCRSLKRCGCAVAQVRSTGVGYGCGCGNARRHHHAVGGAHASLRGGSHNGVRARLGDGNASPLCPIGPRIAGKACARQGIHGASRTQRGGLDGLCGQNRDRIYGNGNRRTGGRTTIGIRYGNGIGSRSLHGFGA